MWLFTTPTVHDETATASLPLMPPSMNSRLASPCAPALGEPPLELLAMRLDAVEGRVLERERVRRRPVDRASVVSTASLIGDRP